MSTNNNKEEKYTTIRIWKKTLKRLRRIYGYTNESMVSTLDRLVAAEFDHLGTKLGHNIEEWNKGLDEED